jgi:hypothetical protein
VGPLKSWNEKFLSLDRDPYESRSRLAGFVTAIRTPRGDSSRVLCTHAYRDTRLSVSWTPALAYPAPASPPRVPAPRASSPSWPVAHTAPSRTARRGNQRNRRPSHPRSGRPVSVAACCGKSQVPRESDHTGSRACRRPKLPREDVPGRTPRAKSSTATCEVRVSAVRLPKQCLLRPSFRTQPSRAPFSGSGTNGVWSSRSPIYPISRAGCGATSRGRCGAARRRLRR